MEVLDIIEHEDGSATYQFDLTPQEHDAMCRNGIMWAILAGVTGITQERVIQDYLKSQEPSKGDIDETRTDSTSTE